MLRQHRELLICAGKISLILGIGPQRLSQGGHMIIHPQHFGFGQSGVKVDVVPVKAPSLLVQFLRCIVIGQRPHHIHKRPPPSLLLAVVLFHHRMGA